MLVPIPPCHWVFVADLKTWCFYFLITITMKTLLTQIRDDNRYTIRGAVVSAALDYDEPEIFFRDLLQNGCASGMVPGLIYYIDTRAFYDQHYDEIESIREDMEDSFGEPITIKGDLKYFFAWLNFEEVAYQIANELELDI